MVLKYTDPAGDTGPDVQRYFAAVGENLIGLSLIRSKYVQSVQIDNLTGSWLLVNPGGFYIQPYLLGWSTNIIPAAQSVDVTFVTSPPGTETQSLTGTGVNIALYNYQTGNAAGTQYLPTLPYKRPYDAQGISTPNAGVLGSVTFPALPNQRYILDTIVASYTPVLAYDNTNTGIFVRDNISGGLPLLFAIKVSGTGPNITDHLNLIGLSLQGSVNTAMTVEFQTADPNVIEWVFAGVYKL